MNTAATTFLNQNSKDFNRLNTLPTPDTVNASNQANRTIGRPAESENTTLFQGEEVLMISGINIPK